MSGSLACRRAMSSLQSASASGSDAQVLSRVIASRRSALSFAADPIDPLVMKDIMASTLRTPSAFNSQPWACVLVKSKQQREALSEAMLGRKNAERVKEAPVTAVFLADLQPQERLEWLVKLERRAGKPEGYIAQLPFMLGVFGGIAGPGGMLTRGILSALSPLQATPTPSVAEAWAFKGACMAAQTFLVAATSHGLGSAPMEGFDACKLASALGIPSRYSIPLVISTGHERQEGDGRRTSSLRFSEDDMFFQDRFGEKIWWHTDGDNSPQCNTTSR
jgi:nitroreductase